ncbi:MAG: hypothetical protein ACTSXX_05760 [Candidatus Baldrarchaeia archaeon]
MYRQNHRKQPSKYRPWYFATLYAIRAILDLTFRETAELAIITT